jgi:hypothetical protein
MGNFEGKGAELTSVGLGFVPGIGTAKGVYEGFSGKDSITGQKLTPFERSMSFVGAVPVGGEIFKMFKTSRKIIRNVAKINRYAGNIERANNGHTIVNTLVDDAY